MRSLPLTLLFLFRKWQPAIFCPALIRRTGFFLLFLTALGEIAWAQPQFGSSTPSPLASFNTISNGGRSAPVFLDWDGDGDFDCFSGAGHGIILYYRNTGSASVPTFAQQVGSNNPLNGINVGSNSKLAFADLDSDGRTDCVIGAQDGLLYYFKNIGSGILDQQFGAFDDVTDLGSPFDGIDVGQGASPSFFDFDEDGDLDCFVGTGTSNINSIMLLRNDGTPSDPFFIPVTGLYDPCAGSPVLDGNPLSGISLGSSTLAALQNGVPTFVDIDRDGDIDGVVGRTDGRFQYFQNTKTGSGCGLDDFIGYLPTNSNTNNVLRNNCPSGTTMRDAGDFSAPFFVDIDGDGDADWFTGNVTGNFIFYENCTCQTPPAITGTCPTSHAPVVLDPVPNPTYTITTADFPGVTAISACNGSPITPVFSPTTLSCTDAGTTVTVTMTFTDPINGRTSSCTVGIPVQDNTPPVNGYGTPPFCSATPYYINLDANGLAAMGTVSTSSVPHSFTDNCGYTLSVAAQPPAVFQFNCASITLPPFLPPNNVPYQIVLRATDNSGNSTTCVSNIIIRDMTGPTVSPATLPNASYGICVAQAGTALHNAPAFTATDNCASTITMTATVTSGPLGAGAPATVGTAPNFNWTFSTVGTYVITYSFTDGTNTTTRTQNVVITNSPLYFSPTCPPSQTVNVNPITGCSASVSWAAPVGLDCATGLATGVTTIGTRTSPSTFPVGTETVVYTASQGSNSIQCFFTVTVVDNQPPIASAWTTVNYTAPTTGTIGNGSATTFNMGTACGVVVNWTLPTATVTDNCVPPNAAPTRRESFAYDAPGLPVTFVPVATGTYAPGSTFPAGTYRVTYDYVDAAGNASASTFTFDFTIEDNTFPTITCPSPITTVTAPGVCYADVFLPKPTLVGDNCPLPTNAVTGPLYGPPFQNVPSGSDFWRFEIGTTNPVNFTVTDGSGNTTTCTMTVTITDNQKPVFTNCSTTDVTLSAGASCTILQTITHPTVTDNSTLCTVPGTITYTLTITGATTLASTPVTSGGTLGVTFNEGISRVRYLAVDAAGNQDSCIYLVRVTNTIAPSFTNCPSFQGSIGNLPTDPGVCYRAITATSFATELGAFGGGVGCDPGTFSFVRLPSTPLPIGTQLGLGTHVLRVTATDYSGNTTACQFSVTIVDLSVPTTTSSICGSTQNFNTDPNLCTTVPNWTVPVFTDNCAVQSLTATYTAPPSMTPVNYMSGTPLSRGTYIFTYTARDAANNPGFCTFTVNINDNQPPVFTNCPTTTQIINVGAPAACSATYTLTLAATDNCSATTSITISPSASVSITVALPTPTPVSQTFTATDLAGRTSTCTITVQARDVSGPVISGCPANQVLTIGSPSVCTLPHPTGWADPTTFSDCTGPVTVVSGPVATSATLTPITVTGTASSRNAQFPVGINTVTYTYRDNAVPANNSTCTFTVEVREGVPPTFTSCPSPITVNAPANACSQTLTTAFMLGLPATQRPVATDLCSPTLTYTTDLPTLGTSVTAPACITVTWNATDASGNSVTLSQRCVQTVCVRDATPPSITCGAPYTATVLPGNTNVENNNALGCYPALCNSTFTPAVPSASDNCTGTLTISRLSGQPGQYPVGVHSLYWVVTDANSNTASCSQQITILGNTTCTPGLASATYTANQTVNLTDLTGITFSPAGCCTTPAFSSVSLVAGPSGAGPYPVNVATPVAYTFTVAGTYTLQYTISCTPKGSGPLTEGSVMTFQRTVTVNPAGCTPTTPSFAVGSNCGSTTPFVLPTTACPANVTVTAAQLGVSATDNCSNAVSVGNTTITNVTASGNYNVTFTATVGTNTVSCSRTVTVTCSACTPTSPSITCDAPTTINVTLTGTNCSTPASGINWGSVTVGDNCTSGSVTGLTGTIGSVTVSSNAPTSFNQNTTTLVTFTASNGLGNAQCQKTVVVAPNTACNSTPTMTLNCPAGVTVSEGDDVSQFPNILTPADVTTSCTGTVVITSDLNSQFPTGFFEPADVYTVTWTATVSGCTSAFCIQDITVGGTTGNVCPWTDQNKETVTANVSLGIDAAATGDRFGSAVEVEDDWAIAGAPWEDDGSSNNNRGAAYILRRNSGNNFDIVKKLTITGGATNDYFGESVSIDVVGGVPTVVVGARGRSSNTGAAYVFSQNQGGPNAWGLVTTLTAGSVVGDAFGTAVAIDGDIIAVGAPGEDEGTTTENGAVYIFRNNAGTWTLENTVRENTPFRATTDNLGGSVAVEMNGTTGYVLAGARQPVAGAGKMGFVLAVPRTGLTTWGTQVKLTAADGTAGDQFGTRVAMDGTTAVIGAALDAPTGTESGSAYVFDVGTGTWAQTAKLQAADGAMGNQFGFAVDIDGNNIIVGARYAATGGFTREGVAYLFKRSSGSWSQIVRNDPSDGSSFDLFGSSVSISGCTAFVGAPTHTTSDLGAVYTYDCGCANPQLRPAQTLEERNKPQSEILDLTSGFAVRCFPNPVQEMLNIELQLDEETETSIVVADAAGRVVTQVFNGVAAPGSRYTWDTATQAAGFYFVRITAGENRKVVPISVIK